MSLVNNTNVKIQNVVIHWRPHQDECLALWQARMFGEKVFPAIRAAKVVFLDKELKRTYPDDIYIGVGGGEFDEHRPDGRLQGTCAALLMAQRLRICEKPGLKELLGEALWCDTESRVFNTQLASLVKAMHRTKGGKDQFGTYVWTAKAFDAIVFGEIDPRCDIRVLWQEYCQAEGVSPQGETAARNVTQFIGASFGRRKSFVTELQHIASCMNHDERYDWLGQAFSMMLQDARMYLEALAEVKERVSSFDIETQFDIEPAYFLESDNEHAGSAMRSALAGKAVVTVVRNSSGLTQISANPNREGVDLVGCCQLIRMAEYKVRTGQKLSRAKSEGLGTTVECPVWHMPHSHSLLNGSLSHPYVEPSKLTMDELSDIILHSFTAKLREEWMDRYQGSSQGKGKKNQTGKDRRNFNPVIQVDFKSPVVQAMAEEKKPDSDKVAG